MEPIAEKFAAFGWATSVINGNDMEQIVGALDAIPLTLGKPSAIIMHTKKCKGLSFAEDNVAYHYWKPSAEELRMAEKELEETIIKKEG